MNVMLDLETMSTAPNAAIVAIGAAAFSQNEIVSQFYCAVDLESSESFGLKIDAATVTWWLKQSKEAQSGLFQYPHDLDMALLNFSKWFPGGAQIWGNAAAFDNVILANAYSACEMKQPWMHWDDRCYRTIKSLCPADIKIKHDGEQHNALVDAVAQAEHLIQMAQAMGIQL